MIGRPRPSAAQSAPSARADQAWLERAGVANTQVSSTVSVNFALTTGTNKVDLSQGLALKDAIGPLATLDEALLLQMCSAWFRTVAASELHSVISNLLSLSPGCESLESAASAAVSVACTGCSNFHLPGNRRSNCKQRSNRGCFRIERAGNCILPTHTFRLG